MKGWNKFKVILRNESRFNVFVRDGQSYIKICVYKEYYMHYINTNQKGGLV